MWGVPREMWGEIVRKLQEQPGSLDVETEALDQGDDAYDVVALPTSASAGCSEATVNRKLSAVSAFYEFHQRHGVDLGDLLATWQRRGSVGGGALPRRARIFTSLSKGSGGSGWRWPWAR